MHDYIVFHHLMNGQPVASLCRGPSMEPVYNDGDPIVIFPFTDDRPDPVVGDVVHFYQDGFFNRHQVADIFTANNGTVWYRLVTGGGAHDQFAPRHTIFGYVIPKQMIDEKTEPNREYRPRRFQ